MFAPLKNIGFFKNVQIEQDGYAISWNDDIDISEYELWKNGLEMKDKELAMQAKEIVYLKELLDMHKQQKSNLTE